MQDIPLKMKMKLMDFARRLPESRRARFLIETSRKIVAFAAEFAVEHKYTVIYGSIGFVVGHVLDTVLVFTIPGIGVLRPTLNLAGVLLGTLGLGYGILRDCDAIRLRNIIVRQVRKALQ